jgi:hypothetical protein
MEDLSTCWCHAVHTSANTCTTYPTANATTNACTTYDIANACTDSSPLSPHDRAHS